MSQQILRETLQKRILNLRKILTDKKIDFLLTQNWANRYYLSGFEGSEGWLLVGRDEAYLFVDSRYTLLAKQQSPHLTVIEISKSFLSTLKDFAKPFFRLGFEGNNLTYQQVLNLKKELKGVKLNNSSGLIEGLRSVKDNWELDLLRQSISVTDRAFSRLLKELRPGLSEKDIAWFLEKTIRELGAQKLAWHPLIVASGPNSASPHSVPTDKILSSNEILMLDFGAVVGGYHSDMTRMVFLGKPSREVKRVYDTVLESQHKAKERIKHGSKSWEIDKVVRGYIEEKGLRAYQHGLSHGVGLEVHELPRVSHNSKDILQTGNVISIEPGVYLDNKYGIRVEDLILIKKDGVETLNNSPTNIDEVTI